MEPLGAGVPVRDHAVKGHADDGVVRGLHDRGGECQRRFGLASRLGVVDSGSASIAMIPMKTCHGNNSWRASRTNRPDPRTVSAPFG